MWIGEEGRVYAVLSFSSVPNTRVVEAEEKEGVTGFWFHRGSYFPVTYHEGEWITATKAEVSAHYEAQAQEWACAGGIPFVYHVAYSCMIYPDLFVK